MEFKGFKINLGELAQVILGVGALLAAWRGRQIAKEKNADAKKEDKNHDTEGA